MNSRLASVLQTVALPHPTPAEVGERAAWAEAHDTSIDPWKNRVIHGDCLEVLRHFPAESVDFVLTDPPYITRYQDRTGRRIANDDNTRWLFPAFAELYRVLKPNTYCVSFYGWGKAERFLSAWRECGFHAVGHFVWVKRYASGVRHVQAKHEQAYLLAKGEPPYPTRPPPDVLPWTYTGNRLHPTQKPVSSLTPLIEAFSKPSGVVLDCFAGSGTTGVAARLCRRQFILIEKEADHYRTAAERLKHQPYYYPPQLPNGHTVPVSVPENNPKR